MCFSAGASFVAGSVLCVAGIVAIKKCKKSPYLLLASIPLFFALQQFTEGFVWLTLTNSNIAVWQQIPIHFFLFFALAFWPVLVPLSIMLIEKNKKRKNALKIMVLLGSMLSVFMVYCLIFRNVTAKVMYLHIYYDIDYSIELPMFKYILYFIPTVFPPFISSHRKLIIFGITILLSYIITSLYFKENIVSVWCFFAAVISVVILYVIWGRNTVQTELKVTPNNN
jgi:hypothetical protein